MNMPRKTSPSEIVSGDEYGGFLTAHKVTDEGTRIVFAGAESVRGSGE